MLNYDIRYDFVWVDWGDWKLFLSDLELGYIYYLVLFIRYCVIGYLLSILYEGLIWRLFY